MKDYTENQNPTYIYKAISVLGDKIPSEFDSCEIPSKATVESMSKKAFADEDNKLFPCYDKFSTFLSLCNVYGEDVKNDDILETLTKRASFFGLGDLVEPISDIFAPQIVKSASTSDEEFALVVEEDGTKHGYWPIADVNELDSTFAEWTRARVTAAVPSDILKEAAVKIVNAASRLGCEDSIPAVLKMASENRIVDLTNVQNQVNIRLNLVNDQESKELYEKMASSVTDENVTEWIQTMDLLDHGLLTPQDRNNELYKTAAETVYSGMEVDKIEKIAFSTLTVEVGDRIILVPMDDFSKMDDTSIDKMYPYTTAEVIKQAKYAGDGVKASGIFASLEDADKVEILNDLKRRVTQ